VPHWHLLLVLLPSRPLHLHQSTVFLSSNEGLDDLADSMGSYHCQTDQHAESPQPHHCWQLLPGQARAPEFLYMLQLDARRTCCSAQDGEGWQGLHGLLRGGVLQAVLQVAGRQEPDKAQPHA